jgi:hypothetical protein
LQLQILVHLSFSMSAVKIECSNVEKKDYHYCNYYMNCFNLVFGGLNFCSPSDNLLRGELLRVLSNLVKNVVALAHRRLILEPRANGTEYIVAIYVSTVSHIIDGDAWMHDDAH